MQALTFAGAGSVQLESVPDPVLQDPGDAIVRVQLAAICGSDLHAYRGNEEGLDPGTVMGHELVGEVVETGADVRSFRRGDTVLCPFTTSCGACFYCREGLSARCVRGALFGWVEDGQGLQGVQAEAVRVPLAESTLLHLPPDLEPGTAFLAGDVLATGWHCAVQAGVRAGSVCAVLGCGPVGLCAVLAALEMGADRVFAVDLVRARLALAREFGAEAVDLSEGGTSVAVREATDGRGADAVLEAVGSPEATRLALELVRPGGTISAVGVHTEADLAFGPGEAYDKNLTYRAGRCPARSLMPQILSWVRSADLPLARLLSHRLPLAEGPRGYEVFDRKLDGCVKVVLQP